MQRRTVPIRSWPLSLARDERGIVLVMALVVMMLLLGVGSTALFSGYTSLLTATNLRLATRARATAESGVNEAIYRLSRQEGQPGAIMPDLSAAFWNNANWQVEINFTGGDTNFTDGTVSTIQPAGDWPDHVPTEPVLMRYKKPNPEGTPNAILFYDRTLTPPFRTITLPAAANAIPDTARPLIQILATALDERGTERQILAEAASTVAFAPPAPLSSGVSVNLNGAGFIDGVNHDHRIHITDGSGSAAIYGDASSETTDSNGIKDSPDDTQFDTGGHGIANPGLLLAPYLYPAYSSYPRLFNKQISSTNTAPAWVGLTWNAVLGVWSGVNSGYASAIALSNGPTVTNDQPPVSGVYTRGVFSWRRNNQSGIGAIPAYPSNCSPNGTPTLVCRPAPLTPFPTFQQYLGLDDTSFQKLLDKPDNCGGNGQPSCTAPISSSKAPLGFTYIKMSSLATEFHISNIQSPGTNDFGLLYVEGSLRISGNFTFKGLIFIDGSLTIAGNPTILGAIMVRGATMITAGTGNMTLLYSRKAAELGIQAAHPWRILSWTDTAMQ